MEGAVVETREPSQGRAKNTIGVPILFILLWTVGLGLAGHWYWTTGDLPDDKSLLFVASLFGGAGGLARSVYDLWQIWILRAMRSEGLSPIEDPLAIMRGSYVKALLWPIPGAVVGLVFSAVLFDAGGSLLKVAAVAAAGGILWESLVKRLPAVFGVGDRKPSEGDNKPAIDEQAGGSGAS